MVKKCNVVSDEERQYVIDNYGKIPVKELALIIDRPSSTVCKILDKAGIKRLTHKQSLALIGQYRNKRMQLKGDQCALSKPWDGSADIAECYR
jgi:hypothetical protein